MNREEELYQLKSKLENKLRWFNAFEKKPAVESILTCAKDFLNIYIDHIERTEPYATVTIYDVGKAIDQIDLLLFDLSDN